MKTDSQLREVGMRILYKNLGLVDTGRFIALINRESFDYTKWQQDLYNDMSLEELCQKADEFWQQTH